MQLLHHAGPILDMPGVNDPAGGDAMHNQRYVTRRPVAGMSMNFTVLGPQV
jgi:hypothetical protein